MERYFKKKQVEMCKEDKTHKADKNYEGYCKIHYPMKQFYSEDLTWTDYNKTRAIELIKNKKYNLSSKININAENLMEPLDLVFHNVCPFTLANTTKNMNGYDVKRLNQFLNKQYKNVLFLDEIHWVCIKGKRRLLSTTGRDIFKNLILENKSNILIIPLSVHSKDVCVIDENNLEPSSHENVFFVNNKVKIIERFDPNFIDTDYELLQLDAFIDKIAHEIGYKYISPFDDLPEHGLQCLQGDESTDCVAWSYLWSEMRIRYPSITRTELFERFLFTLLSEKKENDISLLLHKYIKHYMSCLLKHLN